MRKKSLHIMPFLLISIVLAFYVHAEPPLPTEFYGTIYNYNAPAVSGTIKAYAGNISCGQFNIVNSGYYGILSCIADDPNTLQIEGAIDGQIITFRFNNNPTTVFGNYYFKSGEYHFVNITFPELVCGDGFCDMLENCYSCQADCSCNATTNQTGNFTGNATNATTGGSGSSGSSGGGSGSGGGGSSGGFSGGADFTQSDSGYVYTEDGFQLKPCSEDWNCTEWSECSVFGLQNRTCKDKNNCGTYESRPLEVQECIYAGNCFDGLANCHDGLCEEGIDCGGPCEKKCSMLERPLQNISIIIPKIELPKTVCERKFDISNIGFWIYFLIVLLSIILRYIIQKIMIERIRKNENLTPLEKSRKIISEYQKTKIYSISVIFLSIGFLFYNYYFLLCPNIYLKYSWILLLFMIIAPLLIYVLYKASEYNEQKHYKKSRLLDDMHYQNIMKIIEIENRMLAEEETIVSNKLYELSKNDYVKEIMFKYPDIKAIYNLMLELYDNYSKGKNPYNLEQDFCEKINKLKSDKEFINRISSYPELKNIFERLQGLFMQYEEKKKLYEELLKYSEKEEGKEKEKNDENTENKREEKIEEKKDK